jgi:hypothetical protein
MLKYVTSEDSVDSDITVTWDVMLCSLVEHCWVSVT